MREGAAPERPDQLLAATKVGALATPMGHLAVGIAVGFGVQADQQLRVGDAEASEPGPNGTYSHSTYETLPSIRHMTE